MLPAVLHAAATALTLPPPARSTPADPSLDGLIVGAPTWNTGADEGRSGTAWDDVLVKIAGVEGGPREGGNRMVAASAAAGGGGGDHHMLVLPQQP